MIVNWTNRFNRYMKLGFAWVWGGSKAAADVEPGSNINLSRTVRIDRTHNIVTTIG